MNKTRRRLQKARRRGEKFNAWFRGFQRRYAEHCAALDVIDASAATRLLASTADHAIDEARVTHYECMMRDGAWVIEERA